MVIGTPVANRAQPEVEELIGLFVNTLALRVSLEGSPSVKDLIERVKTVAIGAQDNQDLPFEQIVDLIKPARSLSYSPLFQVMFAWQEQAVTPIEFLGTEYKTLATPMRHAKFDLTLDLTDLGERLVGGIEYSSALFDHETVERFAGYLKRILAEMAADPNGVALKLPMLGSAGAPPTAGGMERYGGGLPEAGVRARAVRGAGGAFAGVDGGGLRGPVAELWGVEHAGQPAGATICGAWG